MNKILKQKYNLGIKYQNGLKKGNVSKKSLKKFEAIDQSYLDRSEIDRKGPNFSDDTWYSVTDKGIY